MKDKTETRIALAGNANVGKSAIFNQLTGLNQVVSNWPGKTVEKVEGTLLFEGHKLKIMDLPGIYSLSTFTMEEIVSREYLASERPDVIINVIDASSLERNIHLTLQILEFGVPTIIALNQIDFATKKGLRIDIDRLSEMLGIPVVPTIAITGSGIKELLTKVVESIECKSEIKIPMIRYGKEIEDQLEKLTGLIKTKNPNLAIRYPARWIAIKLLERDEDIQEEVRKEEDGVAVIKLADSLIDEIEKIHNEPSCMIVASERYGIANRIAKEVTEIVSPPKIAFEERLSAITAHRIIGYPILIAVFAAMFSIIFVTGNLLVGFLEGFFDKILTPLVAGSLTGYLPQTLIDIITKGFVWGVGAGIAIVLPYIIPFYLILAILEDSGYLPRVAFLLDSVMHKIGLHGRAFIPLLIGYGCCVPACVGCRILETKKERLLTGFLVTLIPCAARTIVILGLVGRYLGLATAFLLYIFNLFLVLSIGKIASAVIPGESTDLIEDMPPYRKPMLKAVLKRTWFNTRDFAYIALPLIVGGSVFIQTLAVVGLLDQVSGLMSPVINDLLGLPEITGIPLIFGILRKELTLVLLADYTGSFNFNLLFTPVQMIVFTLFTMIYTPCVATIAALLREFKLKNALLIIFSDILLALLVGSIAFRLLSFLL